MNTTSFWGGGEKWHFETALGLAKRGYLISFIVEKGSELENRLRGTGVKTIAIKTKKWSFLNPFVINKVAQLFLDNHIDVVLFNGPKDLKIGGLAAEKAQVEKVVYRRGIAVEVKRSSLYKRLFGKVVTHFVFNSKSTQGLLVKNYKKELEGKEKEVIFNAIDFPESSDVEQGIGSARIVIGNVGRLVEQKGQRNLLEIGSILKDRGVQFEIRIAGDGPLKESLLNEAKEKGLNKEVKVLGFVEDVPQFMKSIDVLVSTALWEGFGFVLAEAMVQKKPVLAYDLSSNPELIQDGVNGYLIGPANNYQFADRIEQLSKNREQCLVIGKRGYAFARANFEANGQLDKLVKFLGV